MNFKRILFATLFLLPLFSFSQSLRYPYGVNKSIYGGEVGYYKTSADMMANRLTNKTARTFEYFPLSNTIKINDVKVRLSHDTTYWGAKLGDRLYRFYKKGPIEVVLAGPICLYTLMDMMNKELEYTTDGRKC
jgi:hypothetical protein